MSSVSVLDRQNVGSRVTLMVLRGLMYSECYFIWGGTCPGKDSRTLLTTSLTTSLTLTVLTTSNYNLIKLTRDDRERRRSASQ
jgi:hypothetical protein